jgi:hypothetical protein
MLCARLIMQSAAYNECFCVVTLRDKSKMPTHIYTEPPIRSILGTTQKALVSTSNSWLILDLLIDCTTATHFSLY